MKKILGIGALALGLCAGCSLFGKSYYDYNKEHELKYKKLSESGEFEVLGRLYNNIFRNLKYGLSNVDKDPKLDLELGSNSRDYYTALHISDGEGLDNLIDGNVNYVGIDITAYLDGKQGHFKTYIKYDDKGNVTEIYNPTGESPEVTRKKANDYFRAYKKFIEEKLGDKVKIPEGIE